MLTTNTLSGTLKCQSKIAKFSTKVGRDKAQQWVDMLPKLKGTPIAFREGTIVEGAIWKTPSGAEVTVGFSNDEAKHLLKIVDYTNSVNKSAQKLRLEKIMKNIDTDKYCLRFSDGSMYLGKTPDELREIIGYYKP